MQEWRKKRSRDAADEFPVWLTPELPESAPRIPGFERFCARGGGGIVKAIAPIAGAVLGSLILPGIGTALGYTGGGLATVGGALGGALGGGLTSGTKGAILGGLGGAIAPNIGDIASGVGNALGGGTTAPAATAATGASAPGALGAGALAGPSAAAPNLLPPVGADLTSAIGTGAGETALGAGSSLIESAPLAPMSAGYDAGSALSGQMPSLAQEIGNIAPATGAAAGSPIGMPAATSPTLASAAPGAATATAANTAASPAANPGILSSLGINSIGDALKVGVPVAALGYQAMQDEQTIPYQENLEARANQLSGGADSLMAPIQGGPLPAGAQAAIDQATQSAKASIRSQYATMGLSGSTMETEALNNVDRQAEIQRFQIASEMAKTGLAEAGLANTIYGNLINARLRQDDDLSNAIANFAGSMGGGGGVTIRTGR